MQVKMQVIQYLIKLQNVSKSVSWHIDWSESLITSFRVFTFVGKMGITGEHTETCDKTFWSIYMSRYWFTYILQFYKILNYMYLHFHFIFLYTPEMYQTNLR